MTETVQIGSSDPVQNDVPQHTALRPSQSRAERILGALRRICVVTCLRLFQRARPSARSGRGLSNADAVRNGAVKMALVTERSWLADPVVVAHPRSRALELPFLSHIAVVRECFRGRQRENQT